MVRPLDRDKARGPQGRVFTLARAEFNLDLSSQHRSSTPELNPNPRQVKPTVEVLRLRGPGQQTLLHACISRWPYDDKAPARLETARYILDLDAKK